MSKRYIGGRMVEAQPLLSVEERKRQYRKGILTDLELVGYIGPVEAAKVFNENLSTYKVEFHDRAQDHWDDQIRITVTVRGEDEEDARGKARVALLQLRLSYTSITSVREV